MVRHVDMGFDVMHINLHKTFSTPHGRGCSGSELVSVKEFLELFFPVPKIESRKSKLVLNYKKLKSICIYKIVRGQKV
jgi:glycine dehydrogenase subunit 2